MEIMSGGGFTDLCGQLSRQCAGWKAHNGTKLDMDGAKKSDRCNMLI